MSQERPLKLTLNVKDEPVDKFAMSLCTKGIIEEMDLNIMSGPSLNAL